jgi:hypothetical protein
MPERVQDHILSKNVIPQPVFFPSDSPWPFACFASGELLNLMLPVAIVRITRAASKSSIASATAGRPREIARKSRS